MSRSRALLAGLCIASIGSAALAQAPMTVPPAGPSTPPPPPFAQPIPVAPPAAPTAVTPPPPPPPPPPAAGPVVAYIVRTNKPSLIDTTPGSAAFAMVGAFAAIAAGGKLVDEDGIEDPSNGVAKDVAIAYAKAKGYRLADAPILVDKAAEEKVKASKTIATIAGDADYVIDALPPGMNLIYFSFDWTHFDLIYSGAVRVLDVKKNTVVSATRCFFRTEKRPGLLGHDELLADHGAALKALIKYKADQCTQKVETELKILPN
jgi:hypothetical protein